MNNLHALQATISMILMSIRGIKIGALEASSRRDQRRCRSRGIMRYCFKDRWGRGKIRSSESITIANLSSNCSIFDIY